MITAVDTNVILDVLIPNAPHADSSEEALAESVRAGAVIISEAVYAELAAHFPEQGELDRFLSETNIRLQPSSASALHRSGQAWTEYSRRRAGGLLCPACGSRQELRCGQCGGALQPRQHVLADFMVGAHALTHAKRLLTRDRGYYKTYFPELTLG